MTAQTFTDIYDNGYRVESSECHPDAVYLTFLSNNPARWIANEDAPAVALAILEAARVDEHSAAELYAAHFDLRRHVEQEAKKAEREAEDAKVVEFHTAIGANLNRIERHHRDLYNAARRFFEEA